jgi:hypothetical protein
VARHINLHHLGRKSQIYLNNVYQQISISIVLFATNITITTTNKKVDMKEKKKGVRLERIGINGKVCEPECRDTI